jgi:endonuclease YncB( thermonuclease family)
MTSFPTLRSFVLALVFWVPAAVVAQGTTATVAQAPSAARWKLHAPLIGHPCPSHLVAVECPKNLLCGTYKLSRSLPAIVDGDTIRVEGMKESLRLVGLDAEETFKDPGKKKLAETDWSEYLKTENAGFSSERPPKYGTFMGEAAKDGMRQLLEGVGEVRLEWDDSDRKVDGFGRSLVFAYYQKDGTWVSLNVEMVRQGLSPYFIKYGRTRRMNDLFEAAEKEARSHERGIWCARSPFRHYPDYPARLRWWKERADAITAAEAVRKDRPDLFILGQDADWERLKGMAGRRATVFGVAGTPIVKTDLVLLPFGHRRGQDFMVVGSAADIARLDPKKEDGNLLYVTGVVEIYKGSPQFQAATVTWSRQMPPRGGTESAPASR